MVPGQVGLRRHHVWRSSIERSLVTLFDHEAEVDVVGVQLPVLVLPHHDVVQLDISMDKPPLYQCKALEKLLEDAHHVLLGGHPKTKFLPYLGIEDELPHVCWPQVLVHHVRSDSIVHSVVDALHPASLSRCKVEGYLLNELRRLAFPRRQVKACFVILVSDMMRVQRVAVLGREELHCNILAALQVTSKECHGKTSCSKSFVTCVQLVERLRPELGLELESVPHHSALGKCQPNTGILASVRRLVGMYLV
mmetsp:Transcript_11645/g.26562  ORF Transcript_11645/g.26562 Transcript_11645/m.26562 type:complete len:251 (+) Transcript_11645:534-1286(+)